MDRQAELRIIRGATAKQILAAARVDDPSLEAAFGAIFFPCAGSRYEVSERTLAEAFARGGWQSAVGPPWPVELPAAQTGLDPDQGPDSRSTLIVETL